jgi:hypothetical protein
MSPLCQRLTLRDVRLRMLISNVVRRFAVIPNLVSETVSSSPSRSDAAAPGRRTRR